MTISEVPYPPKPEKICSTCVYKHYEYASDVGVTVQADFGVKFIPVCNHPINISGYNLVDGKMIYLNASCVAQRRDNHTINQCGAEGRWYVKKPEAPVKDPAQGLGHYTVTKNKEWDL